MASLAVPYDTDEDAATHWLHDGDDASIVGSYVGMASVVNSPTNATPAAQATTPCRLDAVEAAMGGLSPRDIADALANLDLERINVPHDVAQLHDALPTNAECCSNAHAWFVEVSGPHLLILQTNNQSLAGCAAGQCRHHAAHAATQAYREACSGALEDRRTHCAGRVPTVCRPDARSGATGTW